MTRESIRRRLQKYYPFLSDMYARLAKQGMGVINLSMVFKDVTPTLYIDNCCRVNQLGREIITDAMLESILTTRVS